MEYNMMQDYRDRDNERFCAAIMVTDADTLKELSDDFILPDYLPDVKKVVHVKACARLGNRFLGSGVLEFEGAVAYKVLYIAEDNKVRCAAFLSEFKNKLSCEQLGEDCVDVLHPVTRDVNCRMQNPRKLNIRSKAGVEGAVWRRECFLPELYGARAGEEKKIETMQISLDAMGVTNQRQNGFVYTEDVTLESSMPAIGEIICSNACIYVDECRMSGSELLLRGICDFEILYSVTVEEGEDYILLRRTLPYSESVEAGGIKEGCTCMATVLPEGVAVNVREDEFGKRRMIELDINYGLDILALHPQKMYYCADCYSTARECIVNTQKQKIWHLCPGNHFSFSVNETRTLKEIEASGMREVKSCTVDAIMTLSEQRSAKNHPVFEGNAKVKVLGVWEDGRFGCACLDLPLRFECDKPLDESELRQMIDCRCMGARCRVDNDKMYVDFEVIVNALIMGSAEADAIKVIRMTNDVLVEQDRAAVATLYFVQSNETIFDIAKKYKVARDSLMERNGIENEANLVGHPLLIPNRKS